MKTAARRGRRGLHPVQAARGWKSIAYVELASIWTPTGSGRTLFEGAGSRRRALFSTERVTLPPCFRSPAPLGPHPAEGRRPIRTPARRSGAGRLTQVAARTVPSRKIRRRPGFGLLQRRCNNGLRLSAKSLRDLNTDCRFFLTKRRKTHIICGSAGGVPEWLKGADCKSVGLTPTLVRIQPPPPAFGRRAAESGG